MHTNRWRRRAAALATAGLVAPGLLVTSFAATGSTQLIPAPQPGFELVAAHSGKVAGVAGASMGDGAPVVQLPSTGSISQRWQPLPFGDAFVFVNVQSGKVLDVAGASTANGAPVIQWQWNGGANQVWMLYEYDATHAVFINLGSARVMDTSGASTADGAAVVQWEWNLGANQLWQGVAVGVPPSASPAGNAT